MSKRLFKTMVAVLAIAAAAAGPVRGQSTQSETLLTTVTATSLTTYSQSPDGIVTVSLNDIGSYAAGYGWLCNDGYTGIVTVQAVQGYTITRCVFRQNPNSTPNRVLEDDQAPFTATMDGEEYYVYAATTQGVAYGDDFMNGISTIEVYGYAPAAPQPHTVRLAEGTEEAANWSLSSGNASVPGTQVLENVMSGSELTATYNGTQKVKSVKAVKYVAPAATVTTAPTATEAIIEVGSTAALVNAGAANGGTMMYAVTTTNAQPASTADFSATIPTAQGREAGTYYVWYYAQADANHGDSEIAGPVSVTLAVMTTVTWNSSNVFNSAHDIDELDPWSLDPRTYEGITISGSELDYSYFRAYDHASQTGMLTCGGDEGDSFTFTAPAGKMFCKIEIIDNEGIAFTNYGDWTSDVVNNKIVWSGTAANTVTLGTVFTVASKLNSIVFKLIDAQ